MESEGPFCKVRKKKSSIHCWHATTVEIGRSGRWLRKKPGEENTDQMVIFNKKREDSEWNRKGIRWWMIQKKKKNGRKKRRNKSNFTALLFNDKVLHRYCRTGNFIMIMITIIIILIIIIFIVITIISRFYSSQYITFIKSPLFHYHFAQAATCWWCSSSSSSCCGCSSSHCSSSSR